MQRVAPPPSWPIPAVVLEQQQTAQRAAERRARQLAELHRQYPTACVWYGERAGLWLAAPAGADRLLYSTSAAELAARLAEHYRHQTPRPAPARPTQRRTPGGVQTGAAARSTHSASRAAAPTTPPRRGRHESHAPGPFRRGMTRLGLVADAA